MNPLFLWIREGARRIEEIGAGNPQLEAEYLMAAALGIQRIRLWLIDQAPDAEAIARFDALLARRLAREPLQYVLGTAEFAGLTLAVGPGVFIPRSETEVLVERVVERLRGGGRAGARILDLGTGSGAILLALLARLPDAHGIGVDLSAESLSCARGNAGRLGLFARAAFVRGDLCDGIRSAEEWDAIVSNPPYVMTAEAAELAPEIRDHEPALALFAGDDGLDAIRRIVPAAGARVAPGGLLAIEIGVTQDARALALLAGGPWQDARVKPDLSGRPRILLARKNG